MGRGRAKAKQAKVARQLKYAGASTDLDALRKELVADSSTDSSGGGVDLDEADDEFDEFDDADDYQGYDLDGDNYSDDSDDSDGPDGPDGPDGGHTRG